MSQDAKLDKLVLEYLEKRGLAATSRQLKAESQVLSQQMSLAPSRGATGVVSDLLFYLAAEGKPSNYARGFDSLASWVDNSLDMYRYELSLVLYPVFIHCCLQLVKNEAAGEATQLIGRHSARFTNAGGQRSKVRLQEISELQAVTMPEHLATNRLSQAVTNTRYPVSLCRYSYQLLMHFLEAAHLSLILGIINDHLNLKIEDRMPADLSDAPKAETSLLSGDMEAGSAAAKLSDINLSLLQGLAEDKYLSARAAEQAEEIPEHDETGRPLTKKEKQARQRAAAKERDALAATQANRMEPEIPLPRLTEEDLESRMADIKARVELSADALPSAAFFTFVNTHQSLHCAAFNRSGSHVAGGFGDASIRVYDMEKAGETAAGTTAQEPGDEVLELSGHSGAVYGLDFSPDTDLLFSASSDGTLRLWHLPLVACLNSYRGHNYPVWDVKASPFGHYFASAGADRTARLWSIERNQPLRVLAGHYADVDVLGWHPNAHYLATGSSDHTIRLWDVRQGQVQRMLVGHRAAITSLAFHPNGEVMASADEDGVIICWDLGTAKRLSSAEKHTEPVWSLAYSHGPGSLLASGSGDDSLKLWNAAAPGGGENAELQLLKSFRTKATPVYCTMFSPRNLLLGCGALTLSRKPAK